MSDKDYVDAATEIWNDAKQEYPKTALAVSMLPVASTVTSALELNDAINRGDKVDMALAATGLIPGGSLVKAGVKGAKAGHAAVSAANGMLHTHPSALNYSIARAAADAQVRTGYAKAAAGAGAEVTSATSNVRDYASHRAQQDGEYREAWTLAND